MLTLLSHIDRYMIEWIPPLLTSIICLSRQQFRGSATVQSYLEWQLHTKYMASWSSAMYCCMWLNNQVVLYSLNQLFIYSSCGMSHSPLFCYGYQILYQVHHISNFYHRSWFIINTYFIHIKNTVKKMKVYKDSGNAKSM